MNGAISDREFIRGANKLRMSTNFSLTNATVENAATHKRRLGACDKHWYISTNTHHMSAERALLSGLSEELVVAVLSEVFNFFVYN